MKTRLISALSLRISERKTSQWHASWRTQPNLGGKITLRQLVNALAEFDALGIHFVSLHEGVDTSTPNGRLVFGIFASIAEFERELIRGRVRSGLAAAKAKGKQLGRPRVDVDRTEIETLRASGMAWAGIAQKLGVGVGTIYAAMR